MEKTVNEMVVTDCLGMIKMSIFAWKLAKNCFLLLMKIWDSVYLSLTNLDKYCYENQPSATKVLQVVKC